MKYESKFITGAGEILCGFVEKHPANFGKLHRDRQFKPEGKQKQMWKSRIKLVTNYRQLQTCLNG